MAKIKQWKDMFDFEDQFFTEGFHEGWSLDATFKTSRKSETPKTKTSFLSHFYIEKPDESGFSNHVLESKLKVDIEKSNTAVKMIMNGQKQLASISQNLCEFHKGLKGMSSKLLIGADNSNPILSSQFKYKH